MSNEIQKYFDHETGDELQLTFQNHTMIKNDVLVEMSGVPLLINKENGKVYLPELTKKMVNYFIGEAKKINNSHIHLSPKNIEKEKFSYAKKFDFNYSTIDYEYIPGLVRPWDEGFLTPVFFNIAVLNKYSQHPEYTLELFSETYGTIRNKDNWYIPFGINKNKKVIAWLGDISKLPENEIYYLRSENIGSDHDIHSEFYNAQIEVVASEPSIQSSTFHKRKALNEIVFEKQGFPLYVLEGEISETLEHLDRPVFWEEKHVSPVIEALNRVFVESINVKEIKKYLSVSNSSLDLKSKRGLKLFQTWLEEFIDKDAAYKIMCPFFVLYDFRVRSSHLQSTEKNKESLLSIIERLELSNNAGFEEIYDMLIFSLHKSYAQIIEQILR